MKKESLVLGNAYAIFSPPVTLEFDISSYVRGMDLSSGDMIFSTDAWTSGTRKDFMYGSLTFSLIELVVTE